MLREAGVAPIGGHSIDDKELKYDLSVTGLIHPDRVLAKKTLVRGNKLVLTKPLGAGVINTAIKAGMASPDLVVCVTRLMTTLNRRAAEVVADFPVTACTDITGFRLLGHLAKMVEGSGCGVAFSTGRIPIIAEALDFARMGLIPAGAYRNRQFREDMVSIGNSVDRAVADLCFDLQTSGGLLMSVLPKIADDLLKRLQDAGGD